MALIRVMHCREIATLLDSDRVKDLGFVNRIQVRVHLWVCWHCRLLVRQIQWLASAAHGRRMNYEPDPGLQARILQKLTSAK